MRSASRRLTGRLAALVLTSGLCGGMAACSNPVKLGDTTLEDPAGTLTAAEHRLREDNRDQLDRKQATIGKDSKCFFTKSDPKAKSVDPVVYCGPIRRLGLDDKRTWDSYLLVHTQDDKGKSKATVTGLQRAGVEAREELLERPDGAKPGKVSDVPAPQAPEAPISNKAVALTQEQHVEGLDLHPVEKSMVIRTPTATIEVTHRGTTDRVPTALIGEQADSPYYRPKQGQKIHGVRVRVNEPVPPDTTELESYSSKSKDATATMGLDIGGQNVAITPPRTPGAYPTGSPGESVWRLGCAQLPCRSHSGSGAVSGEFLILASLPEQTEPSLTASVDGQRQLVPLKGGPVSGPMSQVAYSRPDSKQNVNHSFPQTKHTIKEPAPSNTSHDFIYTGSISTVYLTAWFPPQGWAKPGKAWLVVPYTNRRVTGYPFSRDPAQEYWMTIGGNRVNPTFSDDNKNRTEGPVTLAFEVDEQFTDGTFTWQPTGEASTSPFSPKQTFKAPAVTLEVKIPK